jgi:NAD(P)-dependent dehydrogenase (short-subunit alcohol dehydrogenase family)
MCGPVLMNVENEASIAAGAADIERQLSGRGLDGLVNVAGIGMIRPVEYATMQDLRKIFDVNFFGQVAIIQAFLRLLRKKRGRIVSITTVGVNIAIPFGGLLNASKSAFAKLSDTLRLEMRSFGVRVIAIEPGSISTPAVDKTPGDLEKVILSLPAEAQALYGASIRKMGRRGLRDGKEWRFVGRGRSGGPPRAYFEPSANSIPRWETPSWRRPCRKSCRNA